MVHPAATVRRETVKKGDDDMGGRMVHHAVTVREANVAHPVPMVRRTGLVRMRLTHPDRLTNDQISTIRLKTPLESLSLAPGERVSGPSQHAPRVASDRPLRAVLPVNPVMPASGRHARRALQRARIIGRLIVATPIKRGTPVTFVAAANRPIYTAIEALWR